MRIFLGSFIVTIISMIGAFLYDGWNGLYVVVLLGLLEVSLSFDNAIVNAGILKNMDAFWRKIFLTLGILIAAFGMRFIFPLVIVWITAGINPIDGLHLAFHPPTDGSPSYAQIVQHSHTVISSFGGMFLLMLFLDFIFSSKKHYWLTWIEEPLARLEHYQLLKPLIACVALITCMELFSQPRDHGKILLAGICGMCAHIVVGFLGDLMGNSLEDAEESIPLSGEMIDRQAYGPIESAEYVGNSPPKSSFLAGFGGFVYLELIDASFSFDGVIGAFAITVDPILIMIGLGLIGSVYIRSLTMFFVQKNTLTNFVYLEHGAHWTIGVLSIILLIGVGPVEIPESIPGTIGAAIIVLSVISSVMYKRKQPAQRNKIPVKQ